MAVAFLANTTRAFSHVMMPLPAFSSAGLAACIRRAQSAVPFPSSTIHLPAVAQHRTLVTGSTTTWAPHWWLTAGGRAPATQPLLQHHQTPSLVPCCYKARGNTYQPSNFKRKHKHGFHQRMKRDAGIKLIWRRLLKGRRLLTH